MFKIILELFNVGSVRGRWTEGGGDSNMHGFKME